MGYDLITWNPRRGDSGDDLYDIPDDISIGAGDVSGFSSPPTIDQINASSGINQILGLINYRYGLLGSGEITYISVAQLYKWSGSNLASNLQGFINSIRGSEGFAAYSFLTSEQLIGKNIRRQHILDWRKALRISGILTQNRNAGGAYGKEKTWERHDWPYGTNIYEQFAAFSSYHFGQYNGPLGAYYMRHRELFNFPVPGWLTTFDSNTISFGTITKGAGEDDDIAELWLSNTDDSIPVLTDANNFDNLILSCSNNGGSVNGSLVDGTIIGRAGGYLSFIVSTQTERTSASSAYRSGYLPSPGVSLVLDFGV